MAKLGLDEIEAQLDRIKEKACALKDLECIVEKLKLEDGDTVVFKANMLLSEVAYERVMKSLKLLLPESVKIIILEDGLQIDTIIKAK